MVGVGLTVFCCCGGGGSGCRCCFIIRTLTALLIASLVKDTL